MRFDMTADITKVKSNFTFVTSAMVFCNEYPYIRFVTFTAPSLLSFQSITYKSFKYPIQVTYKILIDVKVRSRLDTRPLK